MMLVVLPLLVIGFLILLVLGFWFARRDTNRPGPHPDDRPGVPG